MGKALVVWAAVAACAVALGWPQPGAAGEGPPACTIKGTKKADRLQGTPRADVVCGFAGTDKIWGMGGADVLRGGPGADLIRGNDGADVVNGVSAADQLYGGSGPDIVRGGGGNDLLEGNPQDDRLYGELGDDILIGGGGTDILDGGLGRNRCLEVEDDTAPPACDATAPQIVDVQIDPAVVDTSTQGQAVEFTVRITDDLAGTKEWINGSVFFPIAWWENRGQWQSIIFGRVSGDELDGIYKGYAYIPRYAAQGRWQYRIGAQDRTGNYSELDSREAAKRGFPDGFVQAGLGDITPPELVEMSISDTTVGATGEGATVSWRVRVTDDVAGIETYGGAGPALGVSAWYNGAEQAAHWSNVRLVSGDLHDGVYEGDIVFGKWPRPGLWELRFGATDAAGNQAILGTHELQRAGFQHTLLVQAEETDDVRPQIESFSMTPRRIDTTGGDQEIFFEAEASDNLSGVRYVAVSLYRPDGSTADIYPLFTRTSGDALDGRYTGSVTVPRFSSQGTWTVDVYATDEASNGDYLSAQELAAAGFPNSFYNGP